MNITWRQFNDSSSDSLRLDAGTFPPHLPHVVWTAADLVIPLLAATFLSFWSFQASSRLVPMLTHSQDIYYSADTGRVFANLTLRWSDHFRTKVHPLFSLLVGLPTQLAIKALGFEPSKAVRLLLAATAGVWIFGLFVLFRLIGLATVDAAVFTALGCMCASTMFWFVVPETFAFGALSLLVPLLVLAGGSRYRLPEWASVGASALSFNDLTGS